MQVDTVNITSFTFNSIKSAIFAKLDTSNSQNSTKMSYKKGSDGDAMPHIKILFPRASMPWLEN